MPDNSGITFASVRAEKVLSPEEPARLKAIVGCTPTSNEDSILALINLELGMKIPLEVLARTEIDLEVHRGVVRA